VSDQIALFVAWGEFAALLTVLAVLLVRGTRR
jgi:hypothetical protein